MNLKHLCNITIFLFLNLICQNIESTVKVFVNDSSRTLLVRVYDNEHTITSITLAPGAIQELFITAQEIEKIVIQDANYSKKSFGAMTSQVLQKESSNINDSMTFIIHQNTSVKMYPGTTQKDETLRKIDAIFTKTGTLPTIDLTIHTTKTNQTWVTQDIFYNIKYNKSFLETIKSIFS